MRAALLLLLVAAALAWTESSDAGWAICSDYGYGATTCDPHLAGEIWAYQLNTCIVESAADPHRSQVRVTDSP